MLDPTPGNGQLEEKRAKNGEMCSANDNFLANKHFATLRTVMINLWLRPAMNNALAQSPVCHNAEHKVTSEEGLPLKEATIGMTKDFWGLPLQFPMPQS